MYSVPPGAFLPGVYVLYRAGTVVYVGKTDRPMGCRAMEHADGGRKGRAPKFFDAVGYIPIPGADMRDLVEAGMIEAWRPEYNMLLPDLAGSARERQREYDRKRQATWEIAEQKRKHNREYQRKRRADPDYRKRHNEYKRKRYQKQKEADNACI